MDVLTSDQKLEVRTATCEPEIDQSVHEISQTYNKLSKTLSQHISQKAPFSKRSPSTREHLAGVFKFIHSSRRFRKAPFSVTKSAGVVWTEDQTV